ncbi:MAG: ABC transporter ATP-binding protein, partial [Robiginitomaculum sp.]
RGGQIVGFRSAEELKSKTARQDAIDAFLGTASTA